MRLALGCSQGKGPLPISLLGHVHGSWEGGCSTPQSPGPPSRPRRTRRTPRTRVHRWQVRQGLRGAGPMTRFALRHKVLFALKRGPVDAWEVSQRWGLTVTALQSLLTACHS